MLNNFKNLTKTYKYQKITITKFNSQLYLKISHINQINKKNIIKNLLIDKEYKAPNQ